MGVSLWRNASTTSLVSFSETGRVGSYVVNSCLQTLWQLHSVIANRASQTCRCPNEALQFRFLHREYCRYQRGYRYLTSQSRSAGILLSLWIELGCSE